MKGKMLHISLFADAADCRLIQSFPDLCRKYLIALTYHSTLTLRIIKEKALFGMGEAISWREPRNL